MAKTPATLSEVEIVPHTVKLLEKIDAEETLDPDFVKRELQPLFEYADRKTSNSLLLLVYDKLASLIGKRPKTATPLAATGMKFPPIKWQDHRVKKGGKTVWTHATASYLGFKLRVEHARNVANKVVFHYLVNDRSVGEFAGAGGKQHARDAAKNEAQRLYTLKT